MFSEATHTRETSAGWIALVGAILVALMVGAESVPALAIVLLEGTVALAVLTAAGLAGGWGIRWLGMKDAPLAERLILGAALGIGLLSLAMLGLGSLGWLTKPTAFLLAGTATAAGVTRLVLDLRNMARTSAADAAQTAGSSLNWLWLLACPFAAIMLLAASLPPGVLWREEGFGYDVLEYHLAVPKLFWEQGRITFLANNVYSNFPLNSEMLSLLMMTLRGEPTEAAFMAVIVNAGLAALFAAGAWLAGRRFSRKAGTVAGVLAATTPWIAYLAGIAYVETGMMAMGMCALAAALPKKGSETISGPPASKRTAAPLLVGLLVGLACGYKYTAVPLVAVPVGLALLADRENWRQKLRRVLIFGCGTAMTFSPWLARNAVNTGNPVFPLAYAVFGDRSGTWDDELNHRWQRVHDSPLAERTDEPVIVRAWKRTAGDFRFGAATLLLAGAGAIRRPDRWTAALAAMLIAQLAIWLMVTHLFARFAVVTLLPVLVLAGRALGEEGDTDEPTSPARSPRSTTEARQPPRSPLRRWSNSAGFQWSLVGVLVLGAVWNLCRLGQLYYDHTRPGGVKVAAYGHVDWFTTGQWPGTQHWAAVNALPADAQVMLVGEARTFYLNRPCAYAVVFNRHPLAETAERAPGPAAVLNWLQQRGMTHLLVDWGEIGRLSETYGFPPVLSDPAFYAALVKAGLQPAGNFTYPDDRQPYATLFEVPQP